MPLAGKTPLIFPAGYFIKEQTVPLYSVVNYLSVVAHLLKFKLFQGPEVKKAESLAEVSE